MLDKTSKFDVLKIESKELSHPDVLVLQKVTETGSPFLVVAGYYLSQVGKFDESILAEIETIPENQYALLKESIRKKIGDGMKKTPITFW